MARPLEHGEFCRNVRGKWSVPLYVERVFPQSNTATVRTLDKYGKPTGAPRTVCLANLERCRVALIVIDHRQQNPQAVKHSGLSPEHVKSFRNQHPMGRYFYQACEADVNPDHVLEFLEAAGTHE